MRIIRRICLFSVTFKGTHWIFLQYPLTLTTSCTWQPDPHINGQTIAHQAALKLPLLKWDMQLRMPKWVRIMQTLSTKDGPLSDAVSKLLQLIWQANSPTPRCVLDKQTKQVETTHSTMQCRLCYITIMNSFILNCLLWAKFLPQLFFNQHQKHFLDLFLLQTVTII